MTDDAMGERVEKLRPAGEAICAQLAAQISKLGLPERDERPRPVFDQALFRTETDPYSGEETLQGTWNSPDGYRIGNITFHGDGTSYAEFDVAEPHPADSRWFVESVIAWGDGSMIRAEPQLLSME